MLELNMICLLSQLMMAVARSRETLVPN